MQLTSVAAGLGLLAVGCLAQGNATDACDKGLRIIVARGSSEAPGVGRIGVVAGNVSLAVPGSTISAVVYPATFDNYTTSEAQGTRAVTKAVVDYVKKCPDGKVALVGYSQVRSRAEVLPRWRCGGGGWEEEDERVQD